MMAFRQASRSDWEAISRISTRSGYNDYINRIGPEYIDDGIVTLAEEDGEIMGFSKVDWLPDGCTWLSGLRVDPAHWRKGAGSALTSKAVEISREGGAKAARMLIEESNTGSRALSLKLGFREVEKYVFLEGQPVLVNFRETGFSSDERIAMGWRFVHGSENVDSGRFLTDGESTVYINDERPSCHVLVPGGKLEGSGDGMTICRADEYDGRMSGFHKMGDFGPGLLYEMDL